MTVSWKWLIPACVVLLLFIIYLFVWVLEYRNLKRMKECKDRVDLKIQFHRLIAQIVGGAFLIIGVYVTWENLMVAQKNLTAAQDKQVTDLYTRAVEQLGSTEIEVRLGGIYALERISKDSHRDYWTIIEVLSSYVRERSEWNQSKIEKEEEISTPEDVFKKLNWGWWANRHRPKTDIQAIMTIIGRRQWACGAGEDKYIDLSYTDLRGVNLEGAHLEGADFRGTHLEGARLSGCNLSGANLSNADLRGAYSAEYKGAVSAEASRTRPNVVLKRAILRKANLGGVLFCYASLDYADLTEANLNSAMLMGASLKQCEIFRTYFEATLLTGANLEGVDFGKAIVKSGNLQMTDLSKTLGLTRDMFNSLWIDEGTILPPYLRER